MRLAIPPDTAIRRELFVAGTGDERMENEEMKEITVERDGEKDLSFVGKKVAEISTRGNSSTRWQEYTVYQTKGGKYVIAGASITLWQGEQDGHYAEVYSNIDDMFHALTTTGIGFVAKSLAKQLGYDLSESIE